MAKEKKGKKKPQGSDILASAHNIWLAGLGAVAAAGEEGERLFHDLVQRGKGLEGRLADPVEKAGDSLRGTVKDVQRRAKKTWASFEGAMDERVGAALGKLGVPTRDEIAELTKRVEALTKRLDQAGAPEAAGARKRAAKKKPGARKSAARKRSTKKAAPKAG